MNNEAASTKAEQDYAAAHTAHYKTKDLTVALELYQGVMAVHTRTPLRPGIRESQIQNIAKSVVPKQELLDAEVAMARTHLA